MGVDFRQESVLSPLLFIICMNWIHKRSQTNECATIGACDNAGMKISPTKTEVLYFSRNPDQCSLHVSRIAPKQIDKLKFLVLILASDGRQDEELNNRMGKASAVMRALQYLGAVHKRRPHKIAKTDPLVRTSSSPCGHTINVEKSEFFEQKMRRSHLKTPLVRKISAMDPPPPSPRLRTSYMGSRLVVM